MELKTVISVLLVGFLLPLKSSLMAQNKKPIYVLFDTKSKETYMRSGWSGEGEWRKYRKYRKHKREHGIDFYIEDGLFVWYKKNKVDTLSMSFLKTVHLTHEDEILRRIQEDGLSFYHHDVFGKLYFLEKINDSVLVKYDVEWQYVIE